MKDWTEVIKDRLLNDRSAVPEGELEVIERLIRSRRRRRVLVWSSIPFVFAASLALFLIFKNSGSIQTLEVKTPPEEDRFLVETVVETLFEPDQPFVEESFPTMKNESLTASYERQLEEEPEIIESEEDPILEQEREVPETNTPEVLVFDEPVIKTSARSKRLRFSISTGGFSTGAVPKSSGTFGALGPRPVSVEKDHPIIISYGVSLYYPLSDQVGLTSGVNYYSSSSTSYTLFPLQLKAGYVGIPLHLDWYPFKGRRFSMYVGAGGEARKCVYAKIGDERLKDNRIYYSAIALAGLKYEPIKHIGLFIEPQYSYSFLPENPAVRSALTEYPSSFSLKLGLSFEL